MRLKGISVKVSLWPENIFMKKYLPVLRGYIGCQYTTIIHQLEKNYAARKNVDNSREENMGLCKK